MAWAEEVTEALDAVLPDGDGETAYDQGFGPLTATIPAERWPEALTAARDRLGCTFFDWLSAVDELGEGFAVVCHLARHRVGDVQHLLVRTTLPRESPRLASAVGIFAGAGWHERETSEMFGITFAPGEDGAMAGSVPGEPASSTADTAPDLRHLLLPEEFEGHPLRKDFVLASRVAKPWPGAKDPGESEEGGSPSRRRTRPPGVPEPESWGPRAPGSPAPDPLAHAQPGAPRPRRGPRARPEREPSQPDEKGPQTPGRDTSEREGPDG